MKGQATVAALAAAEAAKNTLSKAVEAAERATGEAREEAAQARAEAASAKQEAEALKVTAEQRRSDLAVLRDECQSLRMKVLDMEEDARVSPSPRKGGMRLMNGDSPFSSMKAYSRLVEHDAKHAIDPDATALSINADTPMKSPASIPAEGGSVQALALTPPASDNIEGEKTAAASVKKLACVPPQQGGDAPHGLVWSRRRDRRFPIGRGSEPARSSDALAVGSHADRRVA
jgi:transposase-like protein